MFKRFILSTYTICMIDISSITCYLLVTGKLKQESQLLPRQLALQLQ